MLCAWLIFGVWTRAPARLAPAPADSPPLTLREVATSSGGDHVGSLVAEAASRLLPLLVVAVLGAAANAYFYQAWLVAATLGLLAGQHDRLLHRRGRGRQRDIGRYSRDILRQMSLLIIPSAAVLGLGAPLVLEPVRQDLCGRGDRRLLRWLCLSSPLIIFNTWYPGIRPRDAAHRAGGRAPGPWAPCSCSGAGYALLGRFGIIGLGFAWIVSQVPTTVTGPVIARTCSPGAVGRGPRHA